MEKQTLYDFLIELVDDGKGDIIYNLFSFNADMFSSITCYIIYYKEEIK